MAALVSIVSGRDLSIHTHREQVDILISKNQALRILYLSSIVPCIIIINFIVYNDTVLHCSTQTYLI